MIETPRNTLLENTVTGAMAGCLATVPMTVAMEAMHRLLPRRERYPLPPRKITMRVAQHAGVLEDLDENDRQRLTRLAHFGMGTMGGALYGLMVGQRGDSRKGVGFGLAFWAANYLGLLPALGIIRPQTQSPPRRVALTILAHVVWGAVLGGLTKKTAESSSSPAVRLPCCPS